MSGPDSVVRFLATEGLTTGTRLRMIASGASGMLVDGDKGSIHLDPTVAGAVEVQVVGGGRP